VKAARSFAAEHAGATFFVLVFAISWGGVAFTVGAPGSSTAAPGCARVGHGWSRAQSFAAA